MKILVIGLDGAALEPLFGPAPSGETWSGLCDGNFRRLMDAGCYGCAESVVPPHTGQGSLAAVPAWMWLRDQISAVTGRQFEIVRHPPAASEWDAFQFVEIGVDRSQQDLAIVPDYYQSLDEQIGSLLETLDEDGAVLVLSGPDPRNHAQYAAFILAAASCPFSGKVEGADLLDIARTLLELGGYDVPPSTQGRSLVAEAGDGPHGPALYEAEEELVRQRLSGLGYI